MSTIHTFFNITATNTRKTTATPTSSDSVVTVSSFSGVIRPVTEVAKLFNENNIGNEFDLVADDSDNVAVGDSIIIGSNTYSTLGVANFEDLEDGSDSYLNIRVVRQ